MSRMFKRKKIFIDPSFQARFILKFCLVVIIASVAIAGTVLWWANQSTTVAIENSKVLVKTTSDFILPMLTVTVMVVSVGAGLCILILGLFLSHRIAGPLHRLRMEVDHMKDGDLARNFNLRAKDELQDLAQSLGLLSNSLRSRHLDLKNACHSLFYLLEEKSFTLTGDDKEKAKKQVDNIRAALDDIKV